MSWIIFSDCKVCNEYNVFRFYAIPQTLFFQRHNAHVECYFLKNKSMHKKYPYLFRNKLIWLPNQVWATDITHVRLKGGMGIQWLYSIFSAGSF
jgi:hypothetical protein